MHGLVLVIGLTFQANNSWHFLIKLTIIFIFLVISFDQALPPNQQAAFIALGVDMTHCTAHGSPATTTELSFTQKKASM